MRAIIKEGNTEIDEIELKPKTFKTGSKGYFGFGKIDIDGEKHQVTFTLIKIHSKDK